MKTYRKRKSKLIRKNTKKKKNLKTIIRLRREGGVNDNNTNDNNTIPEIEISNNNKTDDNLAPGFEQTTTILQKIQSFLPRIRNMFKRGINSNKYNIIQTLGKGSFGSVSIWEHKDKDNNTKFAVKTQIYRDRDKQNIDLNKLTRDEIMKEIKILQYIKSKENCDTYTLCFYGFYEDASNKTIYIATDYNNKFINLTQIIKDNFINNINNNSLIKTEINNLLNNSQYNLDDSKTNKYLLIFINILSKIFMAITKLHEIGIVHNDIKPDNILCNYNDTDTDYTKIEIKIIDFGLSCRINDKNLKCSVMEQYGTKDYMDPIKELDDDDEVKKVLYNKQNFMKCDYWSLGIIYKELLCISVNTDICNDILNFYEDTHGNGNLIFQTEKYRNYRNNYDSLLKNRGLENNNDLTSLKKISDKFYDYAIDKKLPFAKIEDLLNPDLSERKLISNIHLFKK